MNALTRTTLGLVVIATMVLAPATTARADSPEFKCVGSERIERKQSTWGYARGAGSDLRIENTQSSVGWARSAGADWRIETFGGSTLAFVRGSRIEKSNGETWTSLDTARQFAECPDVVAAALWVLRQAGRL